MSASRARYKIRFTLCYFFEKKVHFYPIILVNTKTTIPLRVGRPGRLLSISTLRVDANTHYNNNASKMTYCFIANCYRSVSCGQK